LAYRLSILGNTKVTYFTFESESTDVTNKMIQIMTGVSTKKIDKGILTEEEKEKYYSAAKKLKESKNLIMDDSSEVLLPSLRSKIRKAVESGSKLIIIDQLEQILVGGGGDSTQQEYIKINYLSYRIKAFAKEFNVPIILVHQMNRSIEAGGNRGKDNKPQASDLAQAGEKAPNAILMVSRFENKTYFDWVKNRDYGDMGRREVNFVIDNLWYEDIDGLSEFTNN
jgi:replicative DNA helicase